MPNRDWPIHEPTAEDTKGYVFADGGYQLSGETQDGSICYINDQFVGVERSSAQHPQPLHVGVALQGGSSMKGVFTDFTVYAL